VEVVDTTPVNTLSKELDTPGVNWIVPLLEAMAETMEVVAAIVARVIGEVGVVVVEVDEEEEVEVADEPGEEVPLLARMTRVSVACVTCPAVSEELPAFLFTTPAIDSSKVLATDAASVEELSVRELELEEAVNPDKAVAAALMSPRVKVGEVVVVVVEEEDVPECPLTNVNTAATPSLGSPEVTKGLRGFTTAHATPVYPLPSKTVNPNSAGTGVMVVEGEVKEVGVDGGEEAE
jgi:hypothetical protein